ncbi:MAG: APC family permease [Coxiellaceae bacterium]|nr:APC family permease [Coxiellaceae bacterium]
MSSDNSNQTSLFTAIGIGVGSMIGSGWLFAAFYSAQYAGPISILSWVIGAFIALCLAFLLSEIVSLYQDRGLMARLLTISHNRDVGFVVAISNWLGMVIVIPSEAEATTQYLSTIYPSWSHFIFTDHQLTLYGTLIVCVLMLIYGFINYWGIRGLAKANNFITVIKLAIPLITGISIMAAAFHPGNFTAYHHSFAPYGIGKAFGAVVNSGIFYAFYGFSMISIFASEIKNPRKNVPIALIVSVVLCLIIYLVLQMAFIGAMPTSDVLKGWHELSFTSPLAQLTLMLNLNLLTIVLYADSAVSPSGTAIVYTGTAARNLTAMSQDKQMPNFFNSLHPIHNFSRRSLFFSLLLCFIMVIFFNNWQKIMVIVSVFQLITCIALPVAFTKLRYDEKDRERMFKVPFGKALSFVIYLLLSFLLIQAPAKALFTSLVLHIGFFLAYSISFYRHNVIKIVRAFKSSLGIFIYLAFTAIYGYANHEHLISRPWLFTSFFIIAVGVYFIMLKQRDYQIDLASE